MLLFLIRLLFIGSTRFFLPIRDGWEDYVDPGDTAPPGTGFWAL